MLLQLPFRSLGEFLKNMPYPNPFNPEITMAYSLPEDSFVKIQVIGMMGQEVNTLVREYKNAGNYTVQWNATGFSTGLYFVSMKTESFRKTQNYF